MNNGDIKRMLGVGAATLSDKLRYYKDPFEPPEFEFASMPIDVERFELSGPEPELLTPAELHFNSVVT